MRHFLIAFCLLFGCLPAFAFQQPIQGKVTDSADGNPLAGVSVIIVGTKTGTTTDINGHFSLPVSASKEGTELEFSFVGYNSLRKSISGQGPVMVQLSATSGENSDVIVVGYGTQKKSDLTGSVVSVKADEITKVASTNVMESIQGKVPGLDITSGNGSANSAPSVLLRGHRSIAGSNGPLYIIDGAINDHVEDLNPNDVASMEILKDASATAIYGSRGANGVIIITTKKGQTGAPKVSASVYGSSIHDAGYPHYMTGPEYVAFMRESYRTTGKWSSPEDDSKIFNASELAAIASGTWTDYRDLLIHNGNEQNYKISVSGGSDKTKAYFSAGYNRTKGLFKFDQNEKFTARLNIEHTISKVFKAGLNSQLTYYKISTESDPLNAANKISPLGAAFDSTGTVINYPNNGSQISPLVNEYIANNYADNTNTTRVLTTGYIQITPFQDLTLRSNISVGLSNSREGIFNGRYSIARSGSDPRSQYNTSRSTNLLWENILTYDHTWALHHLAFTGVTSYQTNQSDNGAEQGDGQLIPAQSYYGLGNATSGLIASTGYEESKLVSFTGRINYSFNNKYLLTLTGRSDGSSKLAAGNKWAFFPSVAAGWRISQENFMKNVTAISDLKLRASYGITGNDPLGAYATQSLLTNISFAYGDQSAPGYTFSSQIGNSALKWELSGTKNIGLDFGLLKNRISGSIDWYDTRTKDLLLPRLLPSSTGVSSVIQNIGKTRNTGIEIALNTRNIESANFKWSSAITFTHNKESIEQLATGGQDDIADGWFIGYPVSVFFDYQKIGIWQTDEADQAAKYGEVPGEIKIKDQDGDGKITTSDRVVVGTAAPKWSGGFSNTFTYKGFDLNFYLFARVGQMINANYLRFKSGTTENQALHDYWTPENSTNAFPRPNAAGGVQYLSTLQYVSGSFLKLRNVTLGYTLPEALMSRFKMSSIRLYVSAVNPLTLSHTKDYDPERGGSENFPMTKSFLIGANIDL